MPLLAARRGRILIACQLQDSLDDGAAGIRGSGKDLQDFHLPAGQDYAIRERSACIYSDAHRLTPSREALGAPKPLVKIVYSSGIGRLGGRNEKHLINF